jgi:bifunctional ADP-heptose synthase (sugar kinase/adenylyltransferase)
MWRNLNRLLKFSGVRSVCMTRPPRLEYPGARYHVINRGNYRRDLFSDEGATTVPAQAREVYDVSGAGDTVVAVLACMLAAGASVGDAVRLANRAGGIVVGKLGTAVVLPEELFE